MDGSLPPSTGAGGELAGNIESLCLQRESLAAFFLFRFHQDFFRAFLAA
jgi:hypothetical protein